MFKSVCALTKLKILSFCLQKNAQMLKFSRIPGILGGGGGLLYSSDLFQV